MNTTPLEKRFHKAIEFLKRTRLKQDSKQNLSDLPHYLVLGPNGAGKTSFLAHSGLNFILAKRQKTLNTQLWPPTEHCDFWASKEAVFLDTGRDYTIHNHLGNTPKTIWHTLLRLLRKTRKQKQLNGIILIVNLPEFSAWTHNKKARHENNIRARIEEINHLFRNAVPVYLCFSQCDQIDGFQAFFARLSRVERQQILGTTFPLSTHLEKHALSTHFDEAFDRLQQSIQERTLIRLHQEHNPSLRAQILPFAWRFAQYKAGIMQFIQNTFDGHETEPGLNLRGIYFTSSIQQPPKEMLAQTTVLQFHDLQPQAQLHKSYFIEQTLRKVVFQEASSIYTNKSKAGSQRSTHILFLTICASLVLACTTYWGINFSHNMTQFNRANYELGLYQASNTPTEQTDPTQVVPILNQLTVLKQTLNKLNPPWFMAYLHKDTKTKTIDTAFETALQKRFLPAVGQQLADQITDTANASKQILVGAVTAYMMLAEPINLKPQFVEQWLKVYWDQSYPGQTALNTALQYYLRLALATSSQGIRIDPSILDAAQQVLKPQNQNIPSAMPVFNPTTTDPSTDQQTIHTSYGTITLRRR